jgi:hypothetical protein
MIDFTQRRVRIAVDVASFRGPRDVLTGGTPTNWKGNTARYEVGFFFGLNGGAPTAANQVVDAGDYESLTMEVKASPEATENLMAKTVAHDGFSTLAYTTWNDRTAQHVAFEFSATEANIAVGKHHLVFSGITSDGNVVTLGVGTLIVKEDGTPLDAEDPAPNPGSAISLEQADARYATSGAGDEVPAWTYTAGTISDGLFTTDNAAPSSTGNVTLHHSLFGSFSGSFPALQKGLTILFKNSDSNVAAAFKLASSTIDGNGNLSITGSVVGGTSVAWSGKYYLTFLAAAQTAADVGLGNVTNDAQLKAADLDTDVTMSANSASKIPSQSAVKAYADTKLGAASPTLTGTVTLGDFTGNLIVHGNLQGDLNFSADNYFNIGGVSSQRPANVYVGSSVNAATLVLRSLPTSSSGLSTGDVWNDSGTLKIA